MAVRIGLHTGEPLIRDGDYFGPVVNEAARLRSLGHGGQVLVSPVTRLLARPGVNQDVDFLSLGVFRIRDFTQPQEVFQVTAPGVTSEFPPLRALDTMPPPIAAVVRLDMVGSARLLENNDYAPLVESGKSFARLVRARFDAVGGYALHVADDSVTAAFGTPLLAVEFVRQLAITAQLGGFATASSTSATITAGPTGPLGVTSTLPAVPPGPHFAQLGTSISFLARATDDNHGGHTFTLFSAGADFST